MKHIVVDIETNGPVPQMFSMLSIGAVYHEDPQETFYGLLSPVSDNYLPEAYRVNKLSHEEALTFPDPSDTMWEFRNWVERIKGNDKRIMFVSDTTVFDASFVYWYLWTYTRGNPFGHSSLSIQQLYKGVRSDLKASIYELRDTKHTHNALDDAKGNQEAFTKVMDLIRPPRMYFGKM